MIEEHEPHQNRYKLNTLRDELARLEIEQHESHELSSYRGVNSVCPISGHHCAK